MLRRSPVGKPPSAMACASSSRTSKTRPTTKPASPSSAIKAAPRSSEDNKTAVMFRIPHTSGSLVSALEIFQHAKINLTWIESFPTRAAGNEYVFFVDFEGHIDDPKVAKTLKALEEHCEEVTVLGSYPVAQASG